LAYVHPGLPCERPLMCRTGCDRVWFRALAAKPAACYIPRLSASSAGSAPAAGARVCRNQRQTL